MYYCFIDECEFFVEIRIKEIDISRISSFLLTIVSRWSCCCDEILKKCLRYCCSDNCDVCDHCHVEHLLQIRFDYSIHSWNFLVRCFFSCFSDFFFRLWRFRYCRWLVERNNCFLISNCLWIFHVALFDFDDFRVTQWNALQWNWSAKKFLFKCEWNFEKRLKQKWRLWWRRQLIEIVVQFWFCRIESWFKDKKLFECSIFLDRYSKFIARFAKRRFIYDSLREIFKWFDEDDSNDSRLDFDWKWSNLWFDLCCDNYLNSL